MDTISQKALTNNWDYIIIGTGMGGGVAGLSLAKAGKKILFIEKGLSQEKLNNRGNFPEMMTQGLPSKESFQKAGRRTSSIFDLSYKKPRVFKPFIGEGAGGSSLLYGMAMERGQESDFKNWPISYEEMKPFYSQAELLFGVAPSQLITSQNEQLKNFLTSQGLHPYHLPLASQQKSECHGCQGHLCNHNNKNHAGNRALAEALKYTHTLLLDQCEVQRLIADSNKVSGVVVIRNQQKLVLKARYIVLAAGALETPRILFRSNNKNNSNGIANSSGLVGKNLMRHLIDLYVLTANGEEPKGTSKQLAFNDFYNLSEGKGGTVQSFGKMPPIKVILEDLFRDLSFHSKTIKWIAQLFAPIISIFLKNKLSKSLVIASIVEDSPNENNQVLNTPHQTSFIYKIGELDKLRLNNMRQKMQSTFKSKLKMKILSGEKNTILGHACGTCRMGTDPKNSVVDKNGRAHDLTNLYIVDASLFPTSLGVNPGLTIAANALRIANFLNNNHLNTKNSAKKHHRLTFSLLEK